MLTKRLSMLQASCSLAMKLLTPNLRSHTPRRVSIFCLCVMLAGWWCAALSRAAVQERAAQSAVSSVELDEARRLNEQGVKLFDAGRYAGAIPPAERALALREKALGRDHPSVAESLNLLGKLHRELGDLARAESFLQRALAIREKTPGPEHPDTAATLNDMAELYLERFDFTHAEPLLQRAVSIYERTLGPTHPDIAEPLNNLGLIYSVKGDFARGGPLCARALDIRLKALGPDHPRTGASLGDIGLLLYFSGDLVRGEQFLQSALSVREKALGPDHPDVAETLASLADLYFAKNDIARSEPLYMRALSIREKALGPDHPEVASSLLGLANIYQLKGDAARAEQNILRSVSIREKAFGPDHLMVAESLQTLALLRSLQGQIEQAEQLYRRVLSIREKTFGPDHFSVADSLYSLGALYFGKGDFTQAESFHMRALNMFEKTLGPAHLRVAQSLESLAKLYVVQGDFVRAEPHYGRALSVYEAVFGPVHPLVSQALDNLAELYNEKGDLVFAEQVAQRSLSLREQALSPDHPLVAGSLNRLAMIFYKKGELERAEPLYARALVICEKLSPSGSMSTANALNNLALLYQAKGDVSRAESLFQRVLSMYEKLGSADSPSAATTLNNLAMLSAEKGDYARAEPLYLRALSILEKQLSPDHPSVMQLLMNLATLYAAKGDDARVLQLLLRCNEARERNLSFNFTAGSERQKFIYLSSLNGETYFSVSFHTNLAPANPQARRLALTTILRRKGRTLDTMTDQLASMRRRIRSGELGLIGLNDLSLLDQLSTAQAQLSAFELGGPRDAPPDQYRVALGWLYGRVEQLQDAISRRSAEFKSQTQSVTIEQVQQSLPPGAALVELFAYQPTNAKAKTSGERFGPLRYVAYVLQNQGEPLWADLGEALSVDADIIRLLTALRCPQIPSPLKECPSVAEVKQMSRSVDERLMRPVRKLLGDTRHVFLSPDGMLNLLPFAALVDERGEYLLENYSLTYLTSGRDLLRLRTSAESREPPVVIADPAFGETNAARVVPICSGTAAKSAGRSANTLRVYFEPLPCTAEEAKALAAVLSGARVFTQAQATEAILKKISSPRVLHIATHGFFLPDQPTVATVGARGINLVGDDTGSRVLARSENPLLRSGLALAGANLPPAIGGEDNILTASEAAGLDLSGTKLVVLSACETGVGTVTNGEGVYGLRRALVLAGSESQVMSLWQVSDEATRDLMVGYYKRLLAGGGRTEALRQVQLEMLRSVGRGGNKPVQRLGSGATVKADHSHPYYWAAFIQSGDWRDIVSQPTAVKK